MFLLLVGLCAPVVAQEPGEGVKAKLIRGLVQVIQKQVDKQKAARSGEAAAETPQVAATEVAAEEELTLVKVVENALGPSFQEIKEHYKEQGRGYARQLGDVIADRVLADRRVHKALVVLEVLAGVLIAYLTFVTVLIVAGLRAVKKSNRQILKILEERGAGK